MAADLQEPPQLILEFFRSLQAGEADVVVGTREAREDPWPSRLASWLFWASYRLLIQKEMPSGGVDVFGCNEVFRDKLVNLPESNSTLVGLLFWLGFRRKLVGYRRRARSRGKSAWTFRKKLRYLTDSVFAFSDLPIRLMTLLGATGITVSSILALVVTLAKLSGNIEVPGYAATVLTVIFFGGVNSLGLGIIGSYIWRTFENTKVRPHAIVMDRMIFQGGPTRELLQAPARPR
jgi:hypothetical protein